MSINTIKQKPLITWLHNWYGIRPQQWLSLQYSLGSKGQRK